MIPSSDASSTIKDLAQGFCLGVANIIPGVSGGTFLLIFGIYERVFAVLGQITVPTLKRILRLGGAVLLCREGSAGNLAAFLKEKDFFFLIRLGLGTGAAILGLSGVMKYLLLHHFVVTYALFFGLILVSVIIPIKMFKTFHWGLVLLVLAGMGMTIGVSWGVNPYDKIKFKSDRLALQYENIIASEGEQAAAGHGKLPGGEAARYSPQDYFFIACCGAIAISATVLPGISGALVLILMGAYFDIITALSDLKAFHLETLAFLAAFGIGIVFGGLMFARLVSFVMSRYYDATMAFLTGLMLGSLYALWPFKEVVIMARRFVRDNGGVRVLENVAVYTNINRMPGTDDPLVWALVAFAAGCCIMAVFVRTDTNR